jgi:hypothetical protein
MLLKVYHALHCIYDKPKRHWRVLRHDKQRITVNQGWHAEQAAQIQQRQRLSLTDNHPQQGRMH